MQALSAAKWQSQALNPLAAGDLGLRTDQALATPPLPFNQPVHDWLVLSLSFLERSGRPR